MENLEVLKMWENTNTQTGVYVHSPFCKEQCKYCTYRGTVFNKESYNDYYGNYLPKMISFYRPVLERDNIKTYFFGGGTPSIMSYEVMDEILGMFPNIEEKHTVMEFHMNDWNREQLNVLQSYNFNSVIACIQTFDNDVLKKQNRRPGKDIEGFIKYARHQGMHTLSDLIYFNTGDISKDAKRLYNDISLLFEYDIDEISIFSIYEEEGEFFEVIDYVIQKALNDRNYYLLNSFDSGDENHVLKCSRIIKNGLTIEDVLPQIHYAGEIGGEDANTNMLGIGSLNNHKHTFSRIEDKIEYIEDHGVFKLIYDKDKSPTMRKMINDFYDKIEVIGDPPNGMGFVFKPYIKACDVDNRNKKTTRELSIGFDFKIGNSKEIEEYFEKFKKEFPELTK